MFLISATAIAGNPFLGHCTAHWPSAEAIPEGAAVLWGARVSNAAMSGVGAMRPWRQSA
ncbi:hypothetical protein CUJ84_pRLN1000448 (plasmid) [Rhizobium leguminosarum]|uniref:Uncharacterized protein n=1 Tax=Rhizobium leguminosarum TaxID=384 RepID=A0A2K9ZCE9_RHILE|nr:hypothetical protein CUJ84_pRLN1000448 [Rhizobium leguminosarum]